MIIKNSRGRYLLRNKKLGKTGQYIMSPTILRLMFNRYTSEIEFKAIGLFNTQQYSIEEIK